MDVELADQLQLDVQHTVASVSFRQYSPDEVKAQSVALICRQRAFDDLGRPVMHGLYDQRMGVVNISDGVCVTCKQDCYRCPGHFGHIELPFPAVNPMCLMIVKQLLKDICFDCHRIRWSKRRIDLFTTALRLAQAQEYDYLDALYYWLSTVKRGARCGTEEELVQNSLQSFLDNLPPLLHAKVGFVSKEDVNIQGVDDAFREVGKEVWENAARTSNLINLPSNRWKQIIRSFHIDIPNECDHCWLRTKERVNLGKNKRFVKVFQNKDEQVLFPTEVYDEIKKMWQADKDLFDLMYGQVGRNPDDPWASLDHNVFFVKNVAVPPSRFRPSMKSDNMEASNEHPLNIAFTSILEAIQSLRDVMELDDEAEEDNDAVESDMEIDEGSDLEKPNGTPKKPLETQEQQTQETVQSQSHDIQFEKGNTLKDKKISNAITLIQQGLCYLYDNKASKNLPFIGVRQQLESKAGLFRNNMMGKRVNYSCRSVIGPDVFLETNEVGIPESFAKLLSVPEYVTPRNVKAMRRAVMNGPDGYPGALAVEHWTEDGKKRTLRLTKNNAAREAVAAELLRENGPLPTRVLRHVRNGDTVLFNRQPTLHRVSIMAQKVRVLPGDRTIRFHYANCKSYNADFDGDEMNVHILQDYLARAEAEELMLSNKQYVVPTSGEPVRGLIQDHVAAAAVLSRKEVLFTRPRFCQLLFSATGTIMVKAKRKYKVPEPCIIKPVPLWSGKQLISALLDIVRGDRPGLSLTTRARTPVETVGREENEVVIINGRFLKGTLDKSSIGASVFGAVHGIQEVYGPEASDMFLSAVGKLGTFYLRQRGFSTGIEDLLLDEKAEKARHAVLHGKLAESAIDATNKVYKNQFGKYKSEGPASTLEEATKMTEELIQMFGIVAEHKLDEEMGAAFSEINREATKASMPRLVKRYPLNGFSLMIHTGAKGGNVNANQISCLVGQTKLEGSRVPRMGGSGATLPCFEPYDASPNAGGFIASRFLTGITPFEFFFHAMAGREGLLDTSLKTANSGYLQRCLVKAVEGVKLNYDYTVRDSNGDILQFLYGDDGLDPSKSRWLTNKLQFQVRNRLGLERETSKRHPLVNRFLRDPSARKNTTMLEALSPGTFSKTGVVSEKFSEIVDKYVKEDQELRNQGKVDGWHIEDPKVIRSFLESRYQRCLTEPGEQVGVVAAQGIGEPSTQMTLNTFHHTGSSSAHVTLGIPRLRELLMGAAKYPRTPSMTLPIKPVHGKEGAKKLVSMLQEVKLMDVLRNFTVVNELSMVSTDLNNMRVALVSIVLEFHKPEVYEKEFGISFDKLYQVVTQDFQHALQKELRRRMGYLARELRGTSTAVHIRSALAFLERNRDELLDDEGEEAIELPETQADKDFIVDDAESPKKDKDANANEEEKEKEGKEVDSEDESSDDEEKFGNEDEGDSSDSEDEKDKDKDVDMKDAEKENGNAPANATPDGTLKDKVLDRVGPIEDPAVNEDMDRITLSWVFPCCIQGRLQIHVMARDVLQKLKLHSVKKIGRCFINFEDSQDVVITEGSNIKAIVEMGADLIDMDEMMTNDMFGILRTYGVEALRLALIREFRAVFKAYGVAVDIRHLMLIADYMTQHGGYRGFNRRDMDEVPSPFQQMTFETSVKFLNNAALFGTKDHIQNPSAAISVGNTYKGGSGSVELVMSA